MLLHSGHITAWYSRHDSDILLCTQTSWAQVGLHRKHFSSLCTAHVAPVLRRFPLLHAHQTWRVEDTFPTTNAADAVPEQMEFFCRARRRCSRRLKNHSDHSAWLKISTMTRSWSCAYSRMSRMRVKLQQCSIRRSSRRSERGLDFVKGSQWI